MTRPALRLGILVAAVVAMGCQPVVGANDPSGEDPMALGVRLMTLGQPTQALGAFNRALAQEVTAGALTGAAGAYHALGRREEAEQLLRVAIERDPNFALARNNLGILLYENGDYAAAERELSRAYAITGGTNAAIATNLAFAEYALSQQVPPVVKDADDVDVIQYGHGVFRLSPTVKDPT